MTLGGRASATAVALAIACASLRPRIISAQDPRLTTRLDSTTRVAVLALIDSAKFNRLPTEPLVNKALEGAGKGAEGPRIVVAVRGLMTDMRQARSALGAKATPDEITAGANAVHGGVPAMDLTHLRAAAGRRRLSYPLTVLADLVALNVPVATAADIVVSLTKSGVRDADLATFQRNVRLDIEHGADPKTAATTRARGALLHAGPNPPAPRPD